MINIILAWHTIDSILKITGVILSVLVIVASLLGGTHR